MYIVVTFSMKMMGATANYKLLLVSHPARIDNAWAIINWKHCKKREKYKCIPKICHQTAWLLVYFVHIH